jgi:hypothetical protein
VERLEGVVVDRRASLEGRIHHDLEGGRGAGREQDFVPMRYYLYWLVRGDRSACAECKNGDSQASAHGILQWPITLLMGEYGMLHYPAFDVNAQSTD